MESEEIKKMCAFIDKEVQKYTLAISREINPDKFKVGNDFAKLIVIAAYEPFIILSTALLYVTKDNNKQFLKDFLIELINEKLQEIPI